ncbi:hypothetical protein NDU88_008341 [Pleurodeles waltl]|uniref:Uncharacterized protein n=1 Tax=Pleurodeles waltl TaxID=8319 RepID=A0AAV7NW99_PLEWA|nr:hypothetical protein NDU88_008341 [Pleurodeles waltl]
MRGQFREDLANDPGHDSLPDQEQVICERRQALPIAAAMSEQDRGSELDYETDKSISDNGSSTIWKSPEPPVVAAWERSMLNEVQAESVALHREDTRGLRKYSIANYWDTILHDLQSTHSYEPGGSAEMEMRDADTQAGATDHNHWP